LEKNLHWKKMHSKFVYTKKLLEFKIINIINYIYIYIYITWIEILLELQNYLHLKKELHIELIQVLVESKVNMILNFFWKHYGNNNTKWYSNQNCDQWINTMI